MAEQRSKNDGGLARENGESEGQTPLERGESAGASLLAVPLPVTRVRVSDVVAAAEARPITVDRPSLPRGFYDRAVLDVARDLLGCTLLHAGRAARIVETEAYHQSEPACHAYGTPPRPTVRTTPLFGRPGTAYVYRSYGIHAMLNAVCEPDGTAAAVLIRALEPVSGLAAMRVARAGRSDVELTSGPGKLADAMAIGLDLDRTDLIDGPIRIAGADADARPVLPVCGIRVGITKAAELPWRFADASSPFVSRPRVTV